MHCLVNQHLDGEQVSRRFHRKRKERHTLPKVQTAQREVNDRRIFLFNKHILCEAFDVEDDVRW